MTSNTLQAQPTGATAQDTAGPSTDKGSWLGLATHEGMGYLLLRIGYAAIMLTHGLPKVLGMPHGAMKDPMAVVTSVMEKVFHLPAPGFFALLVAALESAGALMLALGIQTRLVAAAFVVEMIGAAYVHAPTWPWSERGMEMPALMGLVALYMVFRGGGPYSVDQRIGWKS